MSILNKLLGHPLTRGLSVDDPRTTLLRRSIIQDKAFLRALYTEWYKRIIVALPKTKDVLELGSGAGFLNQFLPEVITSEVFQTPCVRLIADACNLPLPNQSLDAIVMTDVFHHIPDVSRFLLEAARCVRPGGIIMIEPWRTPWSEWVYTHLHLNLLPQTVAGKFRIPARYPVPMAHYRGSYFNVTEHYLRPGFHNGASKILNR